MEITRMCRFWRRLLRPNGTTSIFLSRPEIWLQIILLSSWINCMTWVFWVLNDRMNVRLLCVWCWWNMTQAGQVWLKDSLAVIKPAGYPLRWPLFFQIIREVEHLCLNWVVVLLHRATTKAISLLNIKEVFLRVDSLSALLTDLILPILCHGSWIFQLADFISVIKRGSDWISDS